jgi:flagellin-like hook-associated protein FlgL
MNLNLLSLLSQEKLRNNRTQLENSLNKLSSGLAINKASDNSSGLSIADKLRTQSSSIKQSISNANSAVAMLQIADKAMAEISNIHDIIKQKLIQASTATTSNEGRNAIKKDINRYIEQIDNIVSQTNYNQIPLLCHNGLDFQIGENGNNIINLESINLSGDCLLNNGPIETSYQTQNFELVRDDWIGSDATAGRFVQSFGVDFSKYNSTNITNNDLLVPNNNSIVGNMLEIDTSEKSTLEISININSEKYINQDNLFAISTGATLIFKAKDASTKNYFERMMQVNPLYITYDAATNTYQTTNGSYNTLNESFFKTPSLATNETLNFYLSSENAYIVIRNADINSISIAPDGLVGMYDYNNTSSSSSVTMEYLYEYDKNDDLIPNINYTDVKLVRDLGLIYGDSITSSGTDYSKVVSNSLTIDNSVRQEFNITINTKNFTDNNQFFNIQNSRDTLDMLVIEPLDENTKQYFDVYFKMYNTLGSSSLDSGYIYRDDLNWYGIDPRATSFPDKSNFAYFNPSLMMEQTLHFNIINTNNNPSNDLYMNNFIPNEIKISDKQLEVLSPSIFNLIPTDPSTATTWINFYNYFDTNYDPQNSCSITLSYENLHELSIDSFSQKVANNYLCLPDKLLDELNAFRSNVGSTQNQIESATRNLMTQYTNIKSAESVIRDVDYANETANFSKLNIIEQSAIYSQSKIKDRQDDLINIISSSDSK